MKAAQAGFPHVVIRASAGTGKTFQLSNRFIALLAAGEPVETILATTFTRKAAGEILDRVLLRLAEAALRPEKLAELVHHVGDPAIDRRRCLGLLRGVLHQLHRLRVGTLDSFFIQIARSFSLELGLPPGWQIVDEIVDGGLRAEAIQTVLEDESTRDVLRLMHLLTKGQASRPVSRQISRLVDDLYSVYLEAPAEAWELVPRCKHLAADQLQAAIDALAQVDLPDDKRFANARAQDLERARKGDWEEFLAKGLAAKIVDKSKQYYSKPIPPQVVAAYEPLIREAKAVLLGAIANQNKATRRLLQRFDDAYQRLKVARQALRFEDVTRRLGQAWLSQRMEEVVYRLDAQLAHLLLDEFQDTSPLQWRVLRPLAQRMVEGRPRRSLFCVGDVKQAIYGWRGGVAGIFEALGEELPNLESQSLNQSFRSCPVVIETVNRVFEGIASNAVLQNYAVAAGRWAARFQKHTTACTKLLGHCRMVAAPRAAQGENQAAATLEFAVGEIIRLHQEAPGRTLGVLVRKNTAVARLIYGLRQLGIDASEEGGNPLTDSPAVQLVLSLLTLADHPGDTAARFHVANSPLAEELGLARHDDSAAAWRLAYEIRRKLMADGYGPTVYDWVRKLARCCDRRDLDRLLQLVGLAYGYQAQATTRTDDFVSLVSQKKVEDPRAAGVRVMTVHQAKGLQFDVVVLPELDVPLAGQPPRIVVGRPGPTQEINRVCRYVTKELRPLLPDKLVQMFDEHQCQVVEESLCVLYVAMTRAVHALEMIIAPSKENEKTIPSTFAGLLRAALANGQRVDPGAAVYEHGDAGWMKTAPAKQPPLVAAEREAPGEPLTIRLAQSPARLTRGLQRRSPSQLEGGSRISLAQRLRLDTDAVLNRGSLMHAWLEQIEWLDDGQPDDDALLEKARDPASRGLDVPGLIGEFRAALGQPAIAAALSRATFQQPAGTGADCAVHAGPELERPRWEVRRECPFALRDGDAILNGKIDRLVVLYDGDRPVAADVLDFKTDLIPAGDATVLEARVEYYRPQLEAYRRAAASLVDLEPARISARLVFLGPGVIRAV